MTWQRFDQDMRDIDRAMDNYYAYMDAEIFLMDMFATLDKVPHGREALAAIMQRSNAPKVVPPDKPRGVVLLHA